MRKTHPTLVILALVLCATTMLAATPTTQPKTIAQATTVTQTRVVHISPENGTGRSSIIKEVISSTTTPTPQTMTCTDYWNTKVSLSTESCSDSCPNCLCSECTVHGSGGNSSGGNGRAKQFAMRPDQEL